MTYNLASRSDAPGWLYFMNSDGRPTCRIREDDMKDAVDGVCLEHANFSGIPGMFVGADAVDDMLSELSGYRRRRA